MDKKILTFNGLKFAHRRTKGQETVQGLHGFYENEPNGTRLYKPDGTLEAFIVNNTRQGQFLVSAGLSQGRHYFMHSTCSLTERWLNVEGASRRVIEDEIKTMCFDEPAAIAVAPAIA